MYDICSQNVDTVCGQPPNTDCDQEPAKIRFLVFEIWMLFFFIGFTRNSSPMNGTRSVVPKRHTQTHWVFSQSFSIGSLQGKGRQHANIRNAVCISKSVPRLLHIWKDSRVRGMVPWHWCICLFWKLCRFEWYGMRSNWNLVLLFALFNPGAITASSLFLGLSHSPALSACWDIFQSTLYTTKHLISDGSSWDQPI